MLYDTMRMVVPRCCRGWFRYEIEPYLYQLTYLLMLVKLENLAHLFNMHLFSVRLGYTKQMEFLSPENCQCLSQLVKNKWRNM